MAVCPGCRHRLARFLEVDRLRRDATPLRDDPAGRAALRARVQREAVRPGVVATLTLAVLVALLVLSWLQ